jgi:serine/threonine protein phosphatase PrpC
MISDLGCCAAASVTGQDSAFVGRQLCAVADGLGGHPGGDIASAEAIRALARFDEQAGGNRDPEQILRRAFAAAAEAVAKAAAAQPDLAAMATTLTALLRSDDRVVLGHIGDSRAYRLRGGQLTQLSQDHVTEVPVFGSVMTRCVGAGSDEGPDVTVHDARPGDRWLLCSDGLYGEVGDAAIREALAAGTPAAAVDVLLKRADAAGSPDNVTVIVIDGGPGTGTATLGAAST